MGVCYLLEHHYAFIKECQSVYLGFFIEFSNQESLGPEFWTLETYKKTSLLIPTYNTLSMT
jgi:hypothetical protein